MNSKDRISVEETEILSSSEVNNSPHRLGKKVFSWHEGTPEKPGTYVVAILYVK